METRFGSTKIVIFPLNSSATMALGLVVPAMHNAARVFRRRLALKTGDIFE
jgi:hypothetical protein